jgi:copper chaperone NosL
VKKSKTLLGLILVGIITIACSQTPVLDQPPEIRYGQDVCDECNMIINEPRFAAAYYTSDGEARRFDDIGDMCTYHLKHQEEVDRFYVHDYDTEEWLQAETATFVLSEQVYTPMAFGVVAFTERASADSFAERENGIVMSFEHLMDHFGMEDADHEHHNPEDMGDSHMQDQGSGEEKPMDHDHGGE